MTAEEKFWIHIGKRLEEKIGAHPKVWKPKYTKDFLDNLLSYKVGESYLRNPKVKSVLEDVPYDGISSFIPSYDTVRRIFKTKQSKGALSTKNIFSIYFEEMSYLDYIIKYQIQDDNSRDEKGDNNNEQDDNEANNRNSKVEIIEKSQSEIVDFKHNMLSDSLNEKLINKKERELLNKAIAHFNLEEYVEALSILESLANKFSSPRVLLNYGYLLYRSERYEEALNVFRRIIQINPYFIEAYLNAFKVCITTKNTKDARKYSDAAYRLAPFRKDVIQARAMYFYEIGETKQYLEIIGKSTPQSKTTPPTKEELKKIKNNSSILIGNKKISTMLVIFSNSGLRTVMVGYKDEKNNFLKPKATYKWNPLSKLGKEKISIEKLDLEDKTSIIGYRVNGLETTEDKKEEVLGFLIAEFEFENLNAHDDEDYAGLMFVDYGKIMRLEPRKVLVRELLSLPEGDLVDLYQDMLFPKSEFTTTNKNVSSPRVFLSYAREDYSIVDNIFKELRKNGIDAWQDDKSLRIGDEYEDKINEAIEESDFAIIFLSTKSVSKIGFVSKEFRKILDSAKYRPFGFPFALPVKLDNCKVPRQFSKYHWLEIYNDDKDAIHGLIQQIKEQYEIRNPLKT